MERIRRPGLRLVGSALALGALVVAAGAQGPRVWRSPRLARGLEQPEYLVRRWTTADGLPQNTVTSIVLGPEGALWCGTFGGLVRFDGDHFLVYGIGNTPGLRSDRILALHQSTAGDLWIGTQGGGATRARRGTFEAFGLEDGLDDLWVQALGQDGEGRLYAGTRAGLSLFDGERFVPVREATGAFAQGIVCVEPASDGSLWASGHGGIFRVRGLAAELWSDAEVFALHEDPAGRLWVGYDPGLALIERPGAALRHCADLPGSVATLEAFGEGLWVGSTGAPFWITDREALVAELPGVVLPEMPERDEAPPLRALCVDGDGNLWAGFNGGGLVRYRETSVCGWTRAQGFPGRQGQAVVSDGEGGIWVGTDLGLARWSAGSFENVIPDGRDVGSVRALWRDGDGTLWLAGARGLARLERGRLVDVLAPGGAINAVYRDARGRLWVAGEAGALVSDDERRFEPVDVRGSALAGGVQCVAETADGSLWFGLSDGLSRLAEDGLTTFRAGDELPAGGVRALFEDDRRDLWIGTYGGGLGRWRAGAFTFLTTADGLPENVFSQILEHEDFVVTAGNRGAWVCRLSSLREVADGTARAVHGVLVGTAPGMEVVETNGGSQPAGCVAADGQVWIPTIDGLVTLDPAAVTAAEAPPGIVLRGVWADERPIADLDGPLEIEPGTSQVRVGFGTLTSEQPTRFRYRLAGYEDEWTDADPSQEATYAALPPGRYTFEVAAATPTGFWSPVPATLEVRVAPLLWQRAWFPAALAALVVVVLALLTRLRAHRATLRARHLRAVVAERTRELEQEIIERRRVERALRAVREELEARVASRTEELAQALQRLQDDMQERERLERQLFQSQKLESIGRLAGGVAHDFNNLLTVVMGCSSLLEDRVGLDPSLRELVEQIRAAGERASRLTQRLLTFARREVLAPRTLDLNQVVLDLGRMLGRLIGEDVHMSVVPSEVPVFVKADAVHLEQILVNLCINARDAMPGGGKLVISVSSEPRAACRLAASIDPSAERCGVLSVRDTGHGMSADVRERVFEPFFTTKDPSQGSGLGLATCYGIVKQVGGDIAIESAVGSGTTVTVYFPETPESAPGGGEATTLEGERVGGDETVLVIEDEDDVRRVLVKMIQELGYEVLEAPSGNAALRVLAASPGEIDLVLTDVVMPGLRGRPLVDALRRLSPGLPVVFVTGYVDGVVARQGLVSAGLTIVEKPPTYGTLSRAIREALDARARSGADAGILAGDRPRP